MALVQLEAGHGQQYPVAVVLQGPLHQPRFEPSGIQRLPLAKPQVPEHGQEMVAAGLLPRTIVGQVGHLRYELRGHEGRSFGRQLAGPGLGQKAHQPQHAQL